MSGKMPNTLIEQARLRGTPLVEEDASGCRVSFVWQGKQAPILLGDFNEWDEEQPLVLEKTGRRLWARTLLLPRDAYIEYAFVQGGERLPDPYNPRLVSNGLGKYNHYIYLPGAAPTLLAARKRGVPHGTLTRHQVETWDLLPGKRRSLYLYQPPAEGAVPLLVVWDGLDYLRRARLADIVDNLIAQGRIRPFAMVMLENGRQSRTLEYTCSEATLEFLLEAVFPLARQRLSLLEPGDPPGAYGLLGASLGGLMALYTALRLPHIFGRALSQSGTFSLQELDTVVYDLARCQERKPVKVWMDVGRFEWLRETNQRMHGLLQAGGYEVAYREFSGGHNYTAWRDDVWRGLEWLFGQKEERAENRE